MIVVRMGLDVKILGAIDIIAAILILTGDYWIGFYILAIALLIKGLISMAS